MTGLGLGLTGRDWESNEWNHFKTGMLLTLLFFLCVVLFFHKSWGAYANIVYYMQHRYSQQCLHQF